ncbi:archease [Methanoplanus endosymbiosus]|uniref:Archease n=1 Tax=Methanoplanus endosymbiosus TaxID=33865 RepID=A0A9E7PQ29_9EURY|nr:archease [Methanoplanus endosymbiosus]UUX92949.1 archease [Methanoplanus endosymbiosus]
MPFEEIDHTADYMFRCSGRTYDELFTSAAEAMFTLMFDSRKYAGISRRISLDAVSPESLLADFLSEILFISEVDGIVFSDAVISVENSDGRYVLSAQVKGESFNSDLHAGGTEIKGISRSEMNIINRDGTYYTDIIFDV